jgi:aspartyl-tRNA(Asn)/glutamyl-tRNA(Gln) amidotransferase subunit C
MLSLEQIRALARLARIEVGEADAASLRDELNGILAMVEQMQAVDTAGIEPMSHPQDATQRLREDEVTEGDRRDEFQSGAPQTEDGLYLVPRVVE